MLNRAYCPLTYGAHEWTIIDVTEYMDVTEQINHILQVTQNTMERSYLRAITLRGRKRNESIIQRTDVSDIEKKTQHQIR